MIRKFKRVFKWKREVDMVPLGSYLLWGRICDMVVSKRHTHPTVVNPLSDALYIIITVQSFISTSFSRTKNRKGDPATHSLVH